MADLIPLADIDPALIEELLDRAFEPERHKRTAYRIREGMEWLPGLSFAALDENGYLVGTIQSWPVALTTPDGRKHPMVMVGPVAVVPEHQNEGYGKALMLALIGALDERAPLPLVMIGDEDYYGRFFGFSAAPTQGWQVPGPVDPKRLLVRCDNPVFFRMKACWGLGAADRFWHRDRKNRLEPMPYEPPPNLASLSLEEIAALAQARGLPPVDQWKPEHSCDSLMHITADGRWFHDGGEITRAAMIRAFSSLLWRDEDGQHWLVTPQEKQSIEVEDAAFIATDVLRQGDALAFRLNTDDTIIAGPDHPIIARGDPETPAIYLGVRYGMEARLNRSTYGQLVEIALENGELSVASQGERFPLVPA